MANKKSAYFIFITTIVAILLIVTGVSIYGGPENPFTVLIVLLAMASAMLLRRLLLLIILILSLLSLAYVYNLEVGAHHHFTDHLRGMWIANSLSLLLGVLAIYFLRNQNDKISQDYLKSQQLLAQIERMDSMGRLLASTAHQMNTPLANLQLGLNELSDDQNPISEKERQIWQQDMQKSLQQISEILKAIQSDKELVTLKSGKSGQEFSCEHIQKLVEAWARQRRCRVNIIFSKSKPESGSEIKLKIRASIFEELSPVLEAVLDNAYQSYNLRDYDLLNNIEIQFEIIVIEKHLVIKVQDQGKGMSKLEQERALEPLYSNKKSGSGMGLYIAYLLCKRLEGAIEIKSKLNEGTLVSLSFKVKNL